MSGYSLRAVENQAVQLIGTHALATRFGTFTVHGFEHSKTGQIAVVLSNLDGLKSALTCLVRVQMACLYAEAFGSIDCDCSQQIEDGLTLVQTRPPALLVHFYGTDGRGVGLPAKLRMIEIEQKESLAPYQATVQMSRQYADYSCLRMVPEILAKLNITLPLLLVTNNPEKRASLVQAGVNIQGVVNSSIQQKMLSEFGCRELEEKIRVLGHDIRVSDADER